MDITSVLGSLLGIASIIGGQLLEGGHLSQITQGTAALIVVGGTLGSMFLAFTTPDVKKAFAMIPMIYQNIDLDVRPTIEEIIRIATIARKEGVLAVEGQRDSIKNELFKKSIK